MKRRAILAGITALLAPRSLIAQTPSRDGPRRLGVLMGNLADDPVGQSYTASLMQGLRALDWREGANLRIDWRWAGGDPAWYTSAGRAGRGAGAGTSACTGARQTGQAP